jgi:hypothetical protein
MTRYTQVLDNDAIVIPLKRMRGEHRIKCCDCGLVHHLTFETKFGSIIMRGYRDNRATAQVRRHMKTKHKFIPAFVAPAPATEGGR